MKLLKAMLCSIAMLLAGTAPAIARDLPDRIGDVVIGRANSHTVTILVSMSCVFCRALDDKLFPDKARDLVQRGYRIEFLPVVGAPVDEIATAVLRCGPESAYLRRMDRIYSSFSMISRMDEQAAKRWFLAREKDFGFQAGKMKSCFTPARLEANARDTQRAQDRYHYRGTPSIYVDDVFVGNTIEELP